MALSIIFSSVDDEVASQEACSAICTAVPWFFCVGWILSFSALFAKTLRVNKIFHNPVRFSRIKVTMWDVVKPVLALLSIAILILLLWSVLDTPTFTRGVSAFDIYGRAQATKGFCEYRASIPYGIALAVVLVGTLLYAVQQAYAARNISTEFAETEYIFLVLVAIFVTTLLGIPVLFLVGGNPGARFFTVASVIFLVNLAILCLMFIPKIKQRKKGLSQEKDFLGRTESCSIGGSQRVSVNNIQLDDNSEIESVDSGNGGIKIIDTPKELENLESKISTLKIEIDVLRRRNQVNKLPSVVEDFSEEKLNSLAEMDESDEFEMSKAASLARSASSDGSKTRRVDMSGEISDSGWESDVV